jgi:hypothetical protein
MRSHNGGEKLAGKFVPEVVEEVLHGPAEAAMVVGRAEQNNIGAIDARLEFGVTGQIMGSVGIIQGKRLVEEIQNVDVATGLPKLVSDMMDDGARYRALLQAADHGQDAQW